MIAQVYAILKLMNSKIIKTYNLPKDYELIYRQEAKPTIALVIISIIGVFSVYFYPHIGSLFLMVGLFGIFFLPGKTLTDFTPEYVILFNRADKSDCTIVYYNEIIAWRYIKGRRFDSLEIVLENGQVENVECFARYMVVRYMRHFAKAQEKRGKK